MRPWRSRKACSSARGGAVHQIDRDIAAQQTWPWSRRPVRKASLSDSTPAMAAVPSSRQRKKMRKPASRRAIRGAPKSRREPGYASATIRPLCQAHHALAAPRQAVLMRDQEQGGAAFGIQREQQIGDGRAIGAVEIAGGFVGEQDLRPRRQRAGQRHALLLAAGQLRRDNGRCARPGRRRASSASAPVARHRPRPISSSGTATFSSAVMVGIR